MSDGIKVLKNLGIVNFERGYSALILENQYYPFYIVKNYNPEERPGNQWDYTIGYYGNIIQFAKGILNYSDSIGYDRMSEIASKAIDALLDADDVATLEWAHDEIDLNDDEMEYFGLNTVESEE